MLRRLVPSLATEIHLAIRLLHVHPSVARDVRSSNQEPRSPCGQASPGLGKMAGDCAADVQGGVDSEFTGSAARLFSTGLDCRAFAARVFLGLKSLLPHLGPDTLDLLAGSSGLKSEVR